MHENWMIGLAKQPYGLINNNFTQLGLGDVGLSNYSAKQYPSVFDNVFQQQNSSILDGLHNWFNNLNSQDIKTGLGLIQPLAGLATGLLNYNNAKRLTKDYEKQMNFNMKNITDDKNRFLANQKSITNKYMGVA